MHILYISQYFPPEMGAPSARVYEFSREWVRMGHRVTVLTGFPNHPTGIIPVKYRRQIFCQEERDGIKIIRTWIYPAPNKGVTKRILNYLSFPMSSVILGVPEIQDCDVVIATSPQLLVGIAGYLAARRLDLPFVFEVRDLWPDSIEAVKAITNAWLLRGLRWVEEFLYHQAEQIVTVAYSTPRILSKRGVASHKMVVIPNGVDIDFFQPGAQNNNVRKRYAPTGSFLVSYIGTHGMAHALQTVLNTAKMFSKKDNIHFLFVGEGAEKDQLVAWTKHQQLSNVTFVEQQPRETLLSFYQASDVCLVPLRKVPLFQAVLPSKMFEIMGVGRPIILSVEGEAQKLLEKAEAGLAISPESSTELYNAIKYLVQNPEKKHVYGNSGRQYVERFHSRPSLAKTYTDSLEKLISY